jgi:hypothetical protein
LLAFDSTSSRRTLWFWLLLLLLLLPLLLLLLLVMLQVVDVAVGCGTCYALTDDGDVYAWGAGSKGQLGRGMHLLTSYADLRMLSPATLVFHQAQLLHQVCMLLLCSADVSCWLLLSLLAATGCAKLQSTLGKLPQAQQTASSNHTAAYSLCLLLLL